MKKVLFATTALVFSAGIAAAEVSVGGDGRMGVVYNGSDWNFSSRVRVSFTMSGTTDGGLEFGGSMRADQATAATAGTAASVYISGAFGKLSMGDVVGASEALFGDFYEVGYQDLSSNNTGTGTVGTLGLSNDILYLTGDNGGVVGSNATTQNSGPNLLYTGTFGAFSVAASMSDGKAGTSSVDQEYALAGAYTFGNYTVGLGYEAVDGQGTNMDMDMVTLAGVAQFGNTSVKAAVAHRGKDVDMDWYGIGASSVFGATTVGGYVQHIEDNNAAAGTDDSVTWYGLGAEYDLGGGATIKGGVADNDISGSDMVADLGIKFSF
ncbi:outer membrane protein OmpU [Thioclava sp. ES.031]|uniref:porin n=1 Tax=Thioclava sp. ES.031 TaxID=1798203 RepID=UPI000BF91E35|nr:porin [Thioclava sp. ES.031]PFG65018.1 outer membrane protein OmpU [Thioclava sp. ES.031]